MREQRVPRPLCLSSSDCAVPCATSSAPPSALRYGGRYILIILPNAYPLHTKLPNSVNFVWTSGTIARSAFSEVSTLLDIVSTVAASLYLE